MNHISFGSTLKEARIAKGYDINTVARRLRIRPDILQAIEESDFERIPPRGYARNMINSYAHLLGLDANEVTRMYLDEAYANSVGVAHGSMSEMRAQQRATAQSTAHPDRTSGFARVDSATGRTRGSSSNGGQVNGLGRRTYSLEMEDKISGGANRTAAARMGMGSDGRESRTPHPSNRSALQDGRYLNAVEGRSRSPQVDFRQYLPFVLGALIVVVILFVVLNLTVCHQQEPAETIPVTSEQSDGSSTDASADGSSSTDSSDDPSTAATTTTTEKAPTEFTLSYKIADGVSTYLEIKVDGKYVVASDVTGPKSGEYTSSDTIQFVSSNSKGLTVTIDGEDQKIKENSSGIYNHTFKFSDILKQWKKDHPDAADSSSSTKSSSSSSKSSSTDSSDSTSSSKSSTSSDSSSDTSSASSSSSNGSTSSNTLSVTGSSTTSVGSSGSSSGSSSSSDSSE